MLKVSKIIFRLQWHQNDALSLHEPWHAQPNILNDAGHFAIHVSRSFQRFKGRVIFSSRWILPIMAIMLFRPIVAGKIWTLNGLSVICRFYLNFAQENISIGDLFWEPRSGKTTAMNHERDRAKLTVTHPSRHVGISISLIVAKGSLSQGDGFLGIFRGSRGIAEMSIVMNGDSAVWTVVDLFY